MKYDDIWALNLKAYVRLCNLLSSPAIDGSIGKMDVVKSVTSTYQATTELTKSLENGNIINPALVP